MNETGNFVISLDFEKSWGVFDSQPLSYNKNLENVDLVIDKLIKLSEKYEVKLTFSTVGMLFVDSKDDLLKSNPKIKPSYKNNTLNSYLEIDKVDLVERENSIYYAKSVIKKIAGNSNHEIGTHTYSHYYCLADGQSEIQFHEDLKSAKKAAKQFDVKLQSIVFPRNQVNENYLSICKNEGVISYRGTENSIFYNVKRNIFKKYFPFLFRIIRIIDCYINITGSNSHDVFKINDSHDGIVNLPSSRFLRPYLNKLSFFEKYKIKRIIKSMRSAAKKNELFHLWWHPHNFGDNIEENFLNLELIFKEYKKLNSEFSFKSNTMTELALKVLKI